MKAELVDYMGDDLSVVNAARVSFAKVKEEFEQKEQAPVPRKKKTKKGRPRIPKEERRTTTTTSRKEKRDI